MNRMKQSNLRSSTIHTIRDMGNKNIPDDYKCFTFSGRTEFVSVVSNRFDKLRKTDTFYQRNNHVDDGDFKLLPGFTYANSKSMFRSSSLLQLRKSEVGKKEIVKKIEEERRMHA